MDIVAAWDILQTPAFNFAGAPATWMELLAFVLALVMVVFNVREVHWGWPCAALSSTLYLIVFSQNRLYGDASLQLFFALMALWGWWQWLRGVDNDGHTLQVKRISRSTLIRHSALTTVLTVMLGLFLQHFTDTDVPWWDAVPTALSVTATVWVARKFVENWPAWIATNAISISLYAYKGLWLTVLLYVLLIILAAWGWRRWSRMLPH